MVNFKLLEIDTSNNLTRVLFLNERISTYDDLNSIEYYIYDNLNMYMGVIQLR